MLKKLKQSDKKDMLSRYRYSAKWHEQKYELIIAIGNNWTYNIAINQEEDQNEPS